MKFNDVAFAWHALLLSIVVLLQIVLCSGNDDDNVDDVCECIFEPSIPNESLLGVENGEVMSVGCLRRSNNVRSSGQKEGKDNGHVDDFAGSISGDAAPTDENCRGNESNNKISNAQQATGGENVHPHIKEALLSEGAHEADPSVQQHPQQQQEQSSRFQQCGQKQRKNQRQKYSKILVPLTSIGIFLEHIQHNHLHCAQKISSTTKVLILLLLLTCFTGAMMVASNEYIGIFGGEGQWQWVDYLYFLSFVKVGVSIVKYIPQVRELLV